jgi:glycerol-3-phosphate acyltransferase PlsY
MKTTTTTKVYTSTMIAALGGLLFGFDTAWGAVLAMAALLVWRHRGNIANLMAGRESRIGQKKAS